jgi:pimeloyl-ACP methyl ester carboxylesterase
MVIALHCSGVDGGMWRALRDRLGERHRVWAPDLFGARHGPRWHGKGAFSLREEAIEIIDALERSEEPVHLVGHSYGGAVALHAALARPKKIASLCLFEPACFSLLREIDRAAHAEIEAFAGDVGRLLQRGDAFGAMTRFVDYWGGPGSWGAMHPEARQELLNWAPKVTLDFHALLDEPAWLGAYECLRSPSLLLSGTNSPGPVRKISALLSSALPKGALQTLDGVGHMGPFTHRGLVAAAIAQHIERVCEMNDFAISA